METSDQINELATALAAAQGEIENAVKGAENTFFSRPNHKATYADLASVWDACRGPLSKHGLSVLQSPSTALTSENLLRVSVTTRLMHSSGQWIQDTLTVGAKEDAPQAMSSCVTYLKRVTLMSFAGCAAADEDDDAEAAHGRGTNGASKPKGFVPQPAAAAPKGYAEWVDDMRSVADEGTEALMAAWKSSSLDCRRHLTTAQPQLWENLKATAANVSAKHKSVAS